ncbi:MAG: ethanolamine ammonia-lyase [Thalassospira sp.]|uniref:ethanolamine ammonia-lyase subunit EutC n=1 Tax=Thalassospira sp. UBA4513 TaxID=1947675 RepID=UPI000C66A1C9|nr:ethanolamine ammonia-lyase subunit EutC [Thalassospira sp. UBA4513]MBE71551.1 ethanolamine ammonia-lyase [Thalassospira sp.]|tara:strand:+ start:331 stop:1104 length:774 start_codon:yes stop_codon:yes gene_type:complete
MSNLTNKKIPSGLDPWNTLRAHTDARIGLGRVGDGLPTERLLEFQMAHARARDSVHMAFEPNSVRDQLDGVDHAILDVHSAAQDRPTYLQRPDLGRLLDEDSVAALGKHAGDYDVAFILTDGLSARATHDHAANTLKLILDHLGESWSVAPITLATQSRVGLGDEIGAALGAKLTVMLIGERPGLSSADSLGCYLTWGPRRGRSNADRNCVSNIRPAGLPPEKAAKKIAYLMTESRKMGLSGVALKDNSSNPELIEG